MVFRFHCTDSSACCQKKLQFYLICSKISLNLAASQYLDKIQCGFIFSLISLFGVLLSHFKLSYWPLWAFLSLTQRYKQLSAGSLAPKDTSVSQIVFGKILLWQQTSTKLTVSQHKDTLWRSGQWELNDYMIRSLWLRASMSRNQTILRHSPWIQHQHSCLSRLSAGENNYPTHPVASLWWHAAISLSERGANILNECSRHLAELLPGNSFIKDELMWTKGEMLLFCLLNPFSSDNRTIVRLLRVIKL